MPGRTRTSSPSDAQAACARGSLCALLIALIAACLPATRSHAEPPHPVETLASLPASVEFAILLDNAAALASRSADHPVVRLLAEDSSLDATRTAWSRLATRLGWTETEAAEHLLGGRLVIAVRSATDGGAPAWAVLGHVSADTARRLRQRLDAAPRSIVKGHAILSVERGTYELTSRRAGADRDGEIFLLGPSRRPALFDEILASWVANEPTTTQDRPLLESARAWAATDAALLLRTAAASPGITPAAPQDALIVFLSAHADAVTARLSTHALQAPPARRQHPGLPDLEHLRASLGEDAVGLAAWTSEVEPPTLSPLPMLAAMTGLNHLSDTIHNALGDRRILILKRSDNHPGLRLTLALEAKDTAALQPAAERLLSALGAQENSLLSDDNTVTPVRAVPINPAFLRPDTPSPVLAWTFASDPASGADGPRQDRRGGWWIVSVLRVDGPDDDAHIRTVRAAADAVRPERPDSHHTDALATGLFDLPSLAASVPTHPDEPPLLRSVLDTLGAASWEIHSRAGNLLEGRIRIKLSPTPVSQ